MEQDENGFVYDDHRVTLFPIFPERIIPPCSHKTALGRVRLRPRRRHGSSAPHQAEEGGQEARYGRAEADDALATRCIGIRAAVQRRRGARAGRIAAEPVRGQLGRYRRPHPGA